jgi:photosystem II stability/assembly factor-like uncharacterized protein
MRRLVVISLICIGALPSFPLRSGAQWVRAGKPGGGWITSLAVSGTNLFASTRQRGVFLSTDNGATWRAINSGLPERTDFQCLAVSGTNLFAGTVERGVFLSTDNGASWTAVNSGLPEKCSVWRLEASGTNLFAVAGAKRASIFLSTDNGANWKPANSGLPGSAVLCLAASGPNLFAGTGTPITGRDACVFFSTDNGANWKAVNAGLPADNPAFRFAVTGGDLYAGSWHGGRVFRSRNNGSSWTPASFGLPDAADFSLSDLAASGTNLFLGSFKGVFLSTDAGAIWTELNSGLPEEHSVYCLAVSETDLFAGTEEGEVWRLPLADVSIAAYLSEPVITAEDWTEIRNNKDASKAVFIPPEIKSVMQAGLATRQGPQDIPFTIFRYLFFPTKDNLRAVILFSPSGRILVNLPPHQDRLAPTKESLHAVLFFEAKNSDLGFVAKAQDSSPQEQAPPSPAKVHVANLDIFIEFRQTDASGTSTVVREVYVPVYIEEDSMSYDPDKENWYSVGYTLRPGKYTVVMAVTRNDLKDIGVGYFDIDLPGPESYHAALETTPVFFIRELNDLKEPDWVTLLYKGMFKWSTLQVVPNIDNVVTAGEALRVAYYVLGAKPKAESDRQAEYDIEAVYEVQEENGQVAISWIARDNKIAGIDQVLPLKQTLKIEDDSGVREEQRDLTAGKYNLVITVKDKFSGATVEKKVPFEVR